MAVRTPLAVFQRALLLALSALTLMSLTGCDERKRLTSEIETVRRETLKLQPEFVKAQSELNSITKEYQNLRANPAVRSTGAENLTKEVQEMTERKNALELEVAEMRKDFEQYRKSLEEPAAPAR